MYIYFFKLYKKKLTVLCIRKPKILVIQNARIHVLNQIIIVEYWMVFMFCR
jgi:hypothetical protein